MSTAIVTTTIHKPVLLEGYCENAKKFGHTDTFFVLAGDKKTPAEVSTFCRELSNRFGLSIHYLGVEEQEKLLRAWPDLARHLPYNSISRRNIAIWQAYEMGADVIVTIDDDNFALSDDDFVGRHAVVGKEVAAVEVESSTGWYNVCELLEEKRRLPFYHRGYPLDQRWKEQVVSSRNTVSKIAVNAGLWLESPDIDALTWLDLPIESVAYNEKEFPNGVVLANGTWCPFNSQNTAIAREAIPAYFLSPFVGRYDDVWASYIITRIAHHLGQGIQFGKPLVKQERNPHNYLADFDKERMGMELSSRFTDWLKNLELRGQDYRTCFAEISTALAGSWQELCINAQADHKESVRLFSNGLAIWEQLPAGVAVRA